MPYDDIKILAAITEKKLVHLKSFLNITIHQKEAVDADNMDVLDSCINEKHKEIEIIDKLDSLFAEKFSKLKADNNIQSLSEINGDAYPYIRELKEKIIEVNQILKKIQTIDKHNTDTMNQKFNEVKSKLKQVKQGQKINKGYNTASYGTMFIDQKN